ncbi:MAG TPA: aldo/keto reductase [Acidimicrobiales bacterium]|nr:aldo/keto reductase [Acidimicrobiales bacterium]
MRSRRLGTSDLSVGAIAYGCWRFAGASVTDAQAKVEAALDHGMTLIDTAAVYGVDDGSGFGAAEELLGRVLADAPALRDQMIVATKGGITPGVPYDSSPDEIRASCDASLRRLGVDVIDLYQIHRPDLLAHPAEVAEALAGLISSDRVRAIGVSNHSPAQVAALRAHLGEVPLATIQPELSLEHLGPIDDGTLDAAMAHDLTPLAWSPLGGGRLATSVIDPPLYTALDSLADVHGVSRPAIALAFVLAHPSAPIPIIGTQRLDRIADAATAAEVELSKTEWYGLIAAAGRELP